MKKIISALLAVLLIVLGVLPCFAAEVSCNCNHSPIIYVAALGSGAVYLDQGTENERKLFRPETEDILNDFTPLISAAVSLISDKDYDKFGDVLISCVNASFGMLGMDADGNSKAGVTSEEFHPESADHGDHTNYYFGYDFRADPIENAQKLRQYVLEVMELTKHTTVRFRASSMGGVTTMAYLRLYGSDHIENIIFQNCPILGTAVAGELFNGKVEINKDALIDYASGALPSMDSDFFGAVLYTLIDMFDTAGVWEGLVGIADKLVLNLKDRVYDEALIPIFGTMPGIWSFVPHEYYESAKTYMKLDPQVNAKLIEKLDFYHYEVQQKAEEILKGAQAAGTNIYIVAGYNMQRTPLVSAYKNTSDGTVDTVYASVGATCAEIGKKFSSRYTQAQLTDINYISPDRMIDASTCVLPEVTWFIKDMLHCTTHQGHSDLYAIFHASKTQLTVFDMEEYPQFLQNDTVNERFFPVTEEGSRLEEAIKDAQNMTSFYTVNKLLLTLFDLFFGWMFD